MYPEQGRPNTALNGVAFSAIHQQLPFLVSLTDTTHSVFCCMLNEGLWYGDIDMRLFLGCVRGG